MKLRTNKSKTDQGLKTPFSSLATHIALGLTQALKNNGGHLNDSLIEAIGKTENCTTALDNGEPVLVTAGDAVNYSIPLGSREFFALVAKAARASGIKGLATTDLMKAIDSASLHTTLDGEELDIAIYNERLDEDDPSQGVVLNTNSTEGKALLLADGEVKTINEKTGITFCYAPKNGSLAYLPDMVDHDEIVKKLKQMFSNLNDQKFTFVMAYAAFILSHPRDSGLTFPILYLYGSAGTGKTTIARLLTKLLGLGEDTVKAQPRNGRDLVATIAQNYLICFDNCGGINDKLANTLCSVATGGTVDDRKLYTNTDVVATHIHQPMIMTAISFPKQHDLCTRALFVKAGTPKVTYVSDTEIYRKMDAILPQAQSWLLEITAKAMTYLGEVRSISNHRAGDFNTFLAAFEKAMDVNDQSVQHYFNATQEKALNQQVVEHDEFLASIVNVVQQHKHFNGSPSKVHQMMHDSILTVMRRLPRNWPQNSSAFTNKLNRVREQLVKQGVEVISGGKRGTNGRNLTLQLIKEVTPLEPVSKIVIEDVAIPKTVLVDAPKVIENVELLEELPELDELLAIVENDSMEGFDPFSEIEIEIDELVEEEKPSTSRRHEDWSHMTQAESDAALSDYLG